MRNSLAEQFFDNFVMGGVSSTDEIIDLLEPFYPSIRRDFAEFLARQVLEATDLPVSIDVAFEEFVRSRIQEELGMEADLEYYNGTFVINDGEEIQREAEELGIEWIQQVFELTGGRGPSP